MAATDQHIGALEAKVENLERTVERLESTMTEVRDMMLTAKGGWKVFVAVGSISAGIGGVIAKFIPIWFLKP